MLLSETYLATDKMTTSSRQTKRKAIMVKIAKISFEGGLGALKVFYYGTGLMTPGLFTWMFADVLSSSDTHKRDKG